MRKEKLINFFDMGWYSNGSSVEEHYLIQTSSFYKIGLGYHEFNVTS